MTPVVDARNDLLIFFDVDLFVFLKRVLMNKGFFFKDNTKLHCCIHEINLISMTLSFHESPIEIWTFVLIENQIAIYVFSGGLLVTANAKMTLFYLASHLIVEDFVLSKNKISYMKKSFFSQFQKYKD